MNFVNNLKLEMVTAFCEAYGQEFSAVRGNNIIFDNDSFRKLIRDTESYRRGIRQALQQQPEGEAEGEERNQCFIM